MRDSKYEDNLYNIDRTYRFQEYETQKKLRDSKYKDDPYGIDRTYHGLRSPYTGLNKKQKDTYKDEGHLQKKMRPTRMEDTGVAGNVALEGDGMGNETLEETEEKGWAMCDTLQDLQVHMRPRTIKIQMRNIARNAKVRAKLADTWESVCETAEGILMIEEVMARNDGVQ